MEIMHSSELIFKVKEKEMFLICFGRTHDCITCSSHHFDYVSTKHIAYFSLSFFCCFLSFHMYIGVLWPWAHLPQVSLVGHMYFIYAFDNGAPTRLTCGKWAQGHGTPTYTYEKRENNKRKKERSNVYA